MGSKIVLPPEVKWHSIPNPSTNRDEIHFAKDVAGEVSDDYHTFNELYEFRMLYNAALFGVLYAYSQDSGQVEKFNIHKSKRHSDGELCFGGGWFIVMATLPRGGQISNHYPMKDWDLFPIPERAAADKWDGHTAQDVAKRLRDYLGGIKK